MEGPDTLRELMVGNSPPFLEVLKLVQKFSGCDATVLVQGETGTGKELVARAIHYSSERQGFPFIPINCGALPDGLVENELFGHVRGAFTGARDHHAGLVANAEGGTLFLDEVEALSAKAQVVLLRFLQDRVYRPLGAKTAVPGNVRIIAASNKVLDDLVRAGTFRQDLLYRLAILSISMPPLRERGGDVVLLARHFVRHFAHQYRRPEREMSAATTKLLFRHAWPGNVRELENVIHRGFLLADGPHLQLDDVLLAAGDPLGANPDARSLAVPADLGLRQAKAAVVAQFEREFLLRALATSGGNVSAAARLIGKERRAVGKLLRKYGIDRTTFAR